MRRRRGRGFHCLRFLLKTIEKAVRVFPKPANRERNKRKQKRKPMSFERRGVMLSEIQGLLDLPVRPQGDQPATESLLSGWHALFQNKWSQGVVTFGSLVGC